MAAATIPHLGTTLPPESVMVKYFGPKADPSRETSVPFAGHTVTVNKVLAGNVRALGATLAKLGYSGYIRNVGGFRTSVGASGSPIPFSMHQFGAAFDINEDGGPNGNWQTMTLPRPLVRACADAGWFCGESWGGGSRDGGHFQFTGGKVPLTAAGGAAAGTTTPTGNVGVDTVLALVAGAAVPAVMIVALFGLVILAAVGASAAGTIAAARAARPRLLKLQILVPEGRHAEYPEVGPVDDAGRVGPRHVPARPPTVGAALTRYRLSRN